MSVTSKRGISLLAGILWATVSGAPAVADDTELFVYDSSVLAINPNVLFIFDTSGSMDTVVESQANYDPNVDYPGDCVEGRLYWRSESASGEGDPPTCDTERWFEESALECAAAFDAFATNAGRLTDRYAQLRSASWQDLSQLDKTNTVECEDDGEVLGGSWSGYTLQTVYDDNYLNWFYGPLVSTTRSQVMKDVATSLVNSINGVNIGLMRFNPDQGGHVVQAVADVGANRTPLVEAINALPADGFTPLSETMYEAALYYLGHQPHYGVSPGPGVSGSAYQTPVEFGCQKNYIVYLTDGAPTEDVDATDKAPGLPDFVDNVGPSCDGSGDGACLDDLAQYLHESDISDEPGEQNVVTYTIGFAVDLELLDETAELGGGRYYTADNTATLSQALTNIVTSILQTQSTFTSPTVSVNSFNRTRHLNDLFITVFQPSTSVHWPGNLKKYRLRPSDGMIVDVNGEPAVDEGTGFFSEDAQSWWSATTDGRKVAVGGAASRLPEPDARNLYTFLSGSDLTASTNAVSTDNGLLTEELLNIAGTDDVSLEDLIDYMRGRDVLDANQNNSTADALSQMGDPLHSQPASIIYGGTVPDPDIDDALVFFATNDGYLHAIDPSTGVERWAFVAPEFLGDQAELLFNGASPAKHYGIDGSVRLQTFANHDGVIDSSSGEKVYLFFGMRRGGTVYYGLDVTNPDVPKVLWRLDESDLPGLGQTWSNPVPTRLDIEGTDQNGAQTVVVFGGGYDPDQDNNVATTDDSGNAIYIVDSESGDLLWQAGQSGATENFGEMQYSIPADIRVVDLDGDGLADRMYAADMGGQVWRFDIFNGNPQSTLVNGGVIARLGSAGLDTPEDADTRRFYYAPDVALVSDEDSSFMHIGIGSGYRAHPNATQNDDRFYALRDPNPFKHLSQDEFDTRTTITEDLLTDITDDVDAVLGDGAQGWFLRLRTGEKVLAEARTFNNQVFFTTFEPGAPPNANSCEPRLGTNRLYVLDLLGGGPVTNLDGSVEEEELTASDRSQVFNGTLASEVVFIFPSAENPETCVGDECAPPPVACVDLFCFPTNFGNAPIRTFWSQENLDN